MFSYTKVEAAMANTESKTAPPPPPPAPPKKKKKKFLPCLKGNLAEITSKGLISDSGKIENKRNVQKLPVHESQKSPHKSAQENSGYSVLPMISNGKKDEIKKLKPENAQ